MAGIPVSPAEFVKAGVNARVDEIFIARAGKVTAYDDATNTAVVKPMVKHTLYKASGERVYDELPEIPFVPVLFPRVGDYVITMPVPVGTPVALLFLDVSHAEWVEDGELAEPVDAQRHSIGWPVALLGLYPDSDRLSDVEADKTARSSGMVMGQHNGLARIEIVKSPRMIKLNADAVDLVANGKKVDDWIAGLKSAVSGWTPVANDGGAALKTALMAFLNAAGGDSVKCERTKAK